jgi:hypothetical protein
MRCEVCSACTLGVQEPNEQHQDLQGCLRRRGAFWSWRS